MKLESALAALLTDSRHEIITDEMVEQTSQQFRLNDFDADVLRRVSRAELIEARRETRAKRWERICGTVPVTSTLVDEIDGGRTRKRFLRETAQLTVSPGAADWRSREVGTLHRWLTSLPPNLVPPALVARAGLDLIALGLADAEPDSVDIDDLPHQVDIDAILHRVLVVDPRTQYIRCGYDIGTIGTIGDCRSARPVPCVFLLMRRRVGEMPELFRVGPAVAALLDSCQGTLTGSQIARRVERCAPGTGEQALASLCDLHRMGAVRLKPADT